MPKIYECKVYLTEFVKGEPVSHVQVDGISTFKDVHQLLIEKGMKVRLTLGHFRNDLVEHFQILWEQAYIYDIPDEEIGKSCFFPKGVKRYAAKYGYCVEVLNPAPRSDDDE